MTPAWQSVVHSSDTWIFTSALVILFPFLDVLVYRRARSTLQIYAWILLAEWSLVAGLMWMIRPKGLRIADLGEKLGNPSRVLLTSLGLLLSIAVIVFVANKRRTREPSAARLSKAIDQVKRMLPKNRTERAVFIAVALTAGLCEEFLYRGWLLNLIGSAMGSVWIGLIISSVVFGIVFIASGSLFLGQILHTAIDLKNGFAIAKIVTRPENV